MSSHKEIVPGMVKTGAGTLASRLLGLVRDIAMAKWFGAGMAMDMFVIAFRIPNLFRALFGEGALNASFQPVFATEEHSTTGDPRRLLNATITAFGALLLILTAIGWGICGVAFFMADTEKGKLFYLLLLILMPYMPLICLSALQAAALNARGHFLRPALAPTLMNICWIAAIFLFGRRYGITAVAIGILISGVMQYLWQATMLTKTHLAYEPVWDIKHPGLIRIFQLMLPAALGIGVIQVNSFLDQVIAQFCVPGEGANSALNYGIHLMQFPLGVLGTALGTAVLPAFSRRKAAGDEAGFRETVNLALRLCFFISLPCLALLCVLNVPMVRVLFQHGAFDAESTTRSASVLLYYSLGLWAYCGVQVLARAFYSGQNTATPVHVAAWMVLVNLGLNLTLVWPMRESGLALATSIAGAANFVILYWLLRKRTESFGGRGIFRSALKAAIASAFAAGAAYAITLIPFGHGLIRQCVSLGCALAGAGIVYFCLAWLMRSHELRDLATMLPRGNR